MPNPFPRTAAAAVLALAVLPAAARAQPRTPASDTRAGVAANNPPAAAEPFDLKDGDRVLFVGGTFVEREGHLGYLEAALTARFAGRKITFRNLGQSGDTVQADARNLNAGWVNFGPPDQGFNRLQKLVAEIKPTVVIANYGMTESFEGPAKRPAFSAGYAKLLDMIAAAAGTSPRVVLLSPNVHETLPPPIPDPADHNKSLEAYRDAVRELAAKRGARFVDLYAVTRQLSEAAGQPKLTDNGIHPTPEGYRRLADPLLAAMGVPPASPGQDKPTPEQAEKLRRLVAAKNAEFFNYWRPQNDTYILGYRKKEQGRNAVEMPQFLPIVQAKEQEIAAATK
jgi:lysophospholipase L1-like esterase